MADKDDRDTSLSGRSTSGRAGGVGKAGVGGGFSASSRGSSSGGKSSSARSSESPAGESGRAGGVGRAGVSGGFNQAAGLSSSRGTSQSQGYADAARSMRSVGVSSVGGRSIPSPVRPDNRSYAGPRGMGGPGGMYVGAPPSAPSPARPDNFAAGRYTLSRGVSASQPAVKATDFMDRVVDRIVGVESANNPNAKNPLSSATGLGQFLSSTWTAMVDKHRPDLAQTLTPKEVLALRTDPTLARQMTRAYADENAAYLEQSGITATPASVYAAHFLGPVGAVKSYKADKSTPAVDVLGAQVVAANPGIMRGKTIGQVLGYVDRKMRGVSGAPSPVSLPDRPPTPTASPRSDFAGKYLGRPAGPVPSNAAPQAAPTPAGRPATAPTETPVAQKPSLGKKVASTAIDVGVSMVPGIGTAAGIYNVVGPLAGLPSIGDMAVSAIGNGPNATAPRVARDTGNERRTKAPPARPQTPQQAEESFAEKYLAFNDPTPRPSPRQKWGPAGFAG